MLKNNSISAFFMYFFCVMIYFVMFATNESFLHLVYINQEVSFNEYDQIAYYKLLGIVGVFIFLLIFSRFINTRITIILGLSIYYFSIFIISYNKINSQTNYLYFSLYIAGFFSLAVGNFIYIIKDFQHLGNRIILICYYLAMLLASFIDEFIVGIFRGEYLISKGEVILLNFLLLAIIIIVSLRYNFFSSKIAASNYNLSIFIRNIELELICGFSVFYLITVVIDGYEVYSIVDYLVDIIDVSIMHYTVYLIAVVASLIVLWTEKINIYRINLYSIFLLLMLFLTLPYWAASDILSLCNWVIIISLMFVLILFSLLTIAEKFNREHIVTPLHLFMLCCSLGSLCGYFTIDTTENTIGEEGFPIATVCVLLVLLAYYLYIYKKKKLYRLN